MAIVIDGNNTPTAGGIGYGDGTELAFTAAGSAGGVLYSAGSSAPAFTAAGTSGQPIVSGGSGAPVFRPYTLPASDGSASQVLQTNGSGALSFATPVPPALIFINSQTVTTPVSVIDFTTGFSATYDDYLLLFENVVAETSLITFGFRVYKNSSLVTSSTYSFQRVSFTATTVSATSNFSSNDSDFGRAYSTNFTFGEIRVFNANSTNASFLSRVSSIGSANNSRWEVSSNNSAANSFTGLRIYDPSSNNISSGVFRLYGVVKS